MPIEFLLCKHPGESGFTLYQGHFKPIREPLTGLAVVVSTFGKDEQHIMLPERIHRYTTAEQALREVSLILPEPPTSQLENEVDSHYTQLVGKGIAAIEAGEMEKVVLARRRTFYAPVPPLGSVLDSLAGQNLGSFVYLLSSNEFGVWMGATPELLLSVHNHELETMALAGTSRSAHTSAFTGKDLDEHRIVSEEILQILKEEGLGNIRVEGPIENQAGTLVHLMSRITAEASADPLPLANRLHPTSAVSGYPRENAMAFIRENEGLERSLYSGFIGVIGPGEAACYVNLRCGQVWKNSVALYAGAGIINRSIPGDELAETTAKMGILGRVLGLNV